MSEEVRSTEAHIVIKERMLRDIEEGVTKMSIAQQGADVVNTDGFKNTLDMAKHYARNGFDTGFAGCIVLLEAILKEISDAHKEQIQLQNKEIKSKN